MAKHPETAGDPSQGVSEASAVWGFHEAGKFIPLPRLPVERAGFGPPPFDVTLPSGEVRRVVLAPVDDAIEVGNLVREWEAS